ncbi:hypothetical protein PVAND_013000 [Polypedilum vanderplanki]|uniref:FCP1 homology domain-containing protein n=1 Tax=Polypedilum vanderplanki TaxID=319348 RepID=A0A9J6CPE2_POLVA|nr:hypothetical protein PVAND_013000 [Polypedilum vanderplanki]
MTWKVSQYYTKIITQQFHPPRFQKNLLVLDIDQTLYYEKRSTSENWYQRPFLHEFLKGVNEFYDIVIWSAHKSNHRWNKVKVNKTKKNLSREELMNLTKEDLVDRIIKLEAFNVQLKNIIEKRVNEKNQDADDTEHSSREILISLNIIKTHSSEFCYLGWTLKKVCLIESRETSNYNRCGRTDKGVSAFDQVISIDIRSRFEPKDQLTEKAVNEEINYCMLLNKVLPKDIRVISWMLLVTPNHIVLDF